MKKFSLILLVCIYSLSVLGIGIKQFYCCGKLKSTAISFVQAAKEKCDKDNSMEGCCKTTFKNLKVKDTHIAAEGIIKPVKPFTDLHLFASYLIVTRMANEPLAVANVSNAPPLYHGVPVYVLHCVYLI